MPSVSWVHGQDLWVYHTRSWDVGHLPRWGGSSYLSIHSRCIPGVSWQQNPNLCILPRYNFSLTQGVKSDLPCLICPVLKGLLHAINLHYKPQEFSQAKDVILLTLQMENGKLGDQMCQSEGFHKVEVSHIVHSCNWVYSNDSYWFMQNFTWHISHSYMQILCLSWEKQKAFERRWEDLASQCMNAKGSSLFKDLGTASEM